MSYSDRGKSFRLVIRLDYLALTGRKLDLTGEDIPAIEEVVFDGGGQEVTSLSGSHLEPVTRSI